MPSSIRDPATILFSLLVAIGSTGCGFVLGDIPDNPVLDAGTREDAKEDGTSWPDVSQTNDAHSDRGAGGAPVSDVVSTEIATSDTGQRDTSPSDTGPSDTGPVDMGPRDTGSSDTTVSDTMSPRDAPADTPADRSSVDSSVKDATSDPGTPPDPCDMDGDMHRRIGCSGGDDCDDNNFEVHPGATFHETPVRGDAGGGFDFDCNGTPDPEFPTPVDCSLLSLLNCNESTSAFLGKTTPACGQPGDFGHCVKGTLSCGQQIVEPNKIMRCK